MGSISRGPGISRCLASDPHRLLPGPHANPRIAETFESRLGRLIYSNKTGHFGPALNLELRPLLFLWRYLHHLSISCRRRTCVSAYNPWPWLLSIAQVNPRYQAVRSLDMKTEQQRFQIGKSSLGICLFCPFYPPNEKINMIIFNMANNWVKPIKQQHLNFSGLRLELPALHCAYPLPNSHRITMTTRDGAAKLSFRTLPQFPSIS